MTTTDLTLRLATTADAEQLGENHLRAYPMGDRPLAERIEGFRAPKLMPIDTMSVAERGGRIVGQARTIRLRGFFGGVEAGVGGLGGVAVASEARRTGVARALVMDHLHRVREAGGAWAMLYPFAPSFYRAFGWAPSTKRLRWQLRPGDLPRFAERRLVERLSWKNETHLAEIQRVYASHCLRQNGSLARSDAWLIYFKGDRELVAGVRGPGGELTGYVTYQMRATSYRPQSMVVTELLALDDAAERGLLGFLSAQEDQVDILLVDTTAEHPLGMIMNAGTPASQDEGAPGEHLHAANLYTGLMTRIVDLRGALLGRGYGSGDGTLSVQAHDEQLPHNDAPVTLTVEAGRPQVTPGHAPGAPLLEGSIADLARIFVGTLSLREALRYQLVRFSGTADDAARLAALIALPPPHPLLSY